MDIFDMTS